MEDQKNPPTLIAEEFHAKPEYHKFLIGHDSANVRRVQENTGARIVFPTNIFPANKDADRMVITSASVDQAKQQLEDLFKDLVSRYESYLY